MTIKWMGKYTAIGMRVKVETDKNIQIINTCGGNDTTEHGNMHTWTWANPTNRAYPITYKDITAASVECLWQGCKLLPGETRPNPEVLNGNWRLNKGKKPIGAYAGPGQPLITNPGEARRKIYLPAYKHQIESWKKNPEVAHILNWAKNLTTDSFVLRDFDTGRGIDRNGPMSHAWVLAMHLNDESWDFIN